MLPMIDRDLSWLHFNGRVLQEVENEDVPLYERIKFIAIFSSNLDEFFKVRIPHLRNFSQLKKKKRKKLGLKPKKILREILKIVDQQQKRLGYAFEQDILMRLSESGIRLLFNEEFSESQKEDSKLFFEGKIMADLFYQKLGQNSILPFLRNQGLYLVVTLGKKRNPDIALVEIPSKVAGRFIELPTEEKGKYTFAFIDDVIRANLNLLFPNDKIRSAYAIKISRDAELYIDNIEDQDLAREIINRLPDRENQATSRVLYDMQMDKTTVHLLQSYFSLAEEDLVAGGRYHNMSDFFKFPTPIENPDWFDRPQFPIVHSEFKDVKEYFKIINEKDRLIATPYQSFDPVLKWLDQAAVDDDVEEIKITLYRVSNDSAVAKALIKALEKGKKVIAFIEVQARFDEESNYYWGNKLRAAGAEVLYSIAGIKVHSKIFLIKRREESINKYYAYLGTGNFNEKTAKLYTDYGLLTADDRLTEEVEEVFQLLEKKRMNIKCEHLLVSPFSTRERIYRMIDREVKNAKSGKPAYMVLKMNSLEDTEMINHLYKASQKGVKISLIIRGICRLIPGQTGLSENISCVSIIDRYLEHSRVYIFANGGDEQIFLASADLMTRNLDRRVEVCFPLYDKKVKTTVRDMINLHLNDNVKARDISQSLEGRIIPELKLSLRSQEAIYEYFSVK